MNYMTANVNFLYRGIMYIESFDNALSIFKFFGQKKPLDNENIYEVYGSFAKVFVAIYTHLETFSIKD